MAFDERVDEVRYHPSYHSLMELSVSEGLHCRHYETGPGDGGYVARNAAMYLMAQVEVGHGCPISMTGAGLYALEHQPELAGRWPNQPLAIYAATNSTHKTADFR